MALYTIWLALNSWGVVLAGGYLVALFCSWLLQRKSQQPSLLTLYEPVPQASPYDHLATPAPCYPQWKMVNGSTIQFHAVDEVEAYTGEDLSQMIKRFRAKFPSCADLEKDMSPGLLNEYIKQHPHWFVRDDGAGDTEYAEKYYPINEQAWREINEVLAKKEF